MDARDGQKILLSGGSGMLGAAIAGRLKQDGAAILRLVRREAHSEDELRWDPTGPGVLGPAALDGLSAAVHLSGANIAAQRWTARFKREMWASRVLSTQVLSRMLARLRHPPEVLIVASAIGFYGDRGEELLDEDSSAGRGFFPSLCKAWEDASRPAEEAGIRVVHLRTGVVLGPDGGALARMLPIFRLGLGGPLGTGSQWMSWVHEADAASAAAFALAVAGLSGPVNIAAPNPVTNAEFTHALAQAVHRPAFLPAPAFGLRMMFGEMADEALLASARVYPKRLTEAGFSFLYPTLPQALAAALHGRERLQH
jgi:uncharacterized protein